MATEFNLPELGENIDSGDLIKVLVSEGDAIEKDQPVLELETDKATIEVPSPAPGRVKRIHVKEGDKIKVGQLILTLDDAAAQVQGNKEKTEAAPPATEQERAEEKTSVAPIPPKDEVAAAVEARAEEKPVSAVREEIPPLPKPPEPPVARQLAPAAPSVRRLARELGVDINQVSGSGRGGRIGIEDVKSHAKRIITKADTVPPGPALAPAPLPDFSQWGEIERKAMTSVRRATARHMSFAWTTVPHVTQFDKADITELEQVRKRHGEQAKAAGGRLTVTAIALKVAASALKVFPQFAASIDAAREEVIFKKYCHIGVAVDTERGLLVPVIRDVDKKNVLELSVELHNVSEKARSKKLTLEEMSGGVFTITNLGGIGGTAFSPIVNAPEVAILGLARARLEPVSIHGIFQPRLLLPLSLSYDHRLIDGADAARFLRWVAQALEQLSLLPLQG
jgi:pyruvate dehydrogenase E2 component (dihydrolipoamide acetyltransferase)